VASVAGGAVTTALAVRVGSARSVQSFAVGLPVVGRLPVDPAGSELALQVATTLAVVHIAFLPLYVPRPRRPLDTVALAVRRVLLATVALAAVGYFDYTYRLPRLTLVLTSGMLLVLAPAWFLSLRRSPDGTAERVVIVGDDPGAIGAVVRTTDAPILGYVSPPGPAPRAPDHGPVPDGGVQEGVLGKRDRSPVGLDAASFDGGACLGGLSRLEEVFVEYDVDAAVLAFTRPDRAEFFGTLEACHASGVVAKAHADHADAVLTDGPATGELVDIDVEPWDPVNRLLKRAFDVLFAAGVLVALAPVMLAVALAVRLEDGGPVLYGQERTAAFGGTFRVRKFRSMAVDAESRGARLSGEDAGGVDPRVTRVGRIIRRTHLDELPQLWSVLRGEMSVVGPRPERPELDTDMERAAPDWRRRWFVKPGLTGLAQVRGVTAFAPAEKLRYDVEYIRRQSVGFDLRILLRQLWGVAADAYRLLVEDSTDR
jgi:lipopolysaccharide/colanic/teichoic acid biosynthesis glycosyltransferase